jgi:Protein of unknown function (DUF2752)
METVMHWLESHLLSCPVKGTLGIDCPGCGFQRAGLALLRGDVADCWAQYPPLLPFLLTMGLLVVALRSRLRYRMHALATGVAITCTFIAINYAHKMF